MNPLEWLINKIISKIFSWLPQPRPSQQAISQTLLVAHRGVHEDGLARENTLESFRLATANQIWAVELDVRFTRDHIPVIHHDAHCGCIFKRPDLIIKNCDFKYLREQIADLPSLQEVADQFGQKLHLMIEMKENINGDEHKIESLRRSLQKLKPSQDYHLLSLEPDLLTPCTFAPPETYVDVIWLSPKPILQKNYDLGHGTAAGHFLFFNSNTIQQLHAKGKKVGVGFLDSRNSLYREINRGVDFIFTNHPLRLKRYLDKPS